MDHSVVKRGDIYYADLSPVVGSEQGGVRPVLIVQNDTGNRHSPTVIAAAITSQTGKARLPTHISVAPLSCGLPKQSVILLEQVRTLDKRRLKEKMGHLDEAVMEEVNNAIAVSFGLHEGIRRSEEEEIRESADSEHELREPAARVQHNPVSDPRPPREPQPRRDIPNVAAATKEEEHTEG